MTERSSDYVTRTELAHAIEAAIAAAMDRVMARIEARRVGPGTWISAVIGCVAVVMTFAAMMGGLVLFAIVGLTGPMQGDIAHLKEEGIDQRGRIRLVELDVREIKATSGRQP